MAAWRDEVINKMFCGAHHAATYLYFLSAQALVCHIVLTFVYNRFFLFFYIFKTFLLNFQTRKRSLDVVLHAHIHCLLETANDHLRLPICSQ